MAFSLNLSLFLCVYLCVFLLIQNAYHCLLFLNTNRNRYTCIYLGYFVPKVINEMASNKHSEDSVKSAAVDENDKIINEIRIDEEEPTIISSVDKNNGLNNAVHQEENEIVASNVANESLDIKKKDVDNTGKETKCDSISPIIPKDDQDDDKTDKKQDTEQKVGKQEIQIVETPLPFQNVDAGKDSHNEDSKDPLKGGPVLKRKRKNLR